MKFKKIVIAANFHDPNELAEEFINNGKRVVNEDNRIIVSLSRNQSLYLEGLFQGKRLHVVPDNYYAKGYYVDGNRAFSWHLQKGTGIRDQIVAIYRYTKDDYQTGNIDKKIEDVPRRHKKIVKPEEPPRLDLF